MSWTDDLTAGFAVTSTAQGIGTYNPTTLLETLTDADKPFVLGVLEDKPDTQIGIIPYNQQPDHVFADVVQPLQVTIRSASRATVNQIADDLIGYWEGRVNATVGGIDVPLITLNSDVQGGIDTTGRPLRHLNFYLAAMRQTASRLD